MLSGARPWSTDSLRDLTDALKAATGQPWRVTLVDEPGGPTLAELARAADDTAKQAILDSPIVQAARAAFPDATLEGWPGQRSAP